MTRHQMYTRMFSVLDLPLRGNILGVSGLKYFVGSRNYKPPCQVVAPDARITQADYPDIDMRKLPYDDKSFDVVIADQVIEHIDGDVQQAVHEARRLLVTYNDVHYPHSTWIIAKK